MKTDLIHPKKRWTRPAGLLAFALVFMFASTDAVGQTALSRISRLKADRSTRTRTTLKASYNYSPRYPAAGKNVQFMDVSSGDPVSWLWDFGDGTTSTAQNPVHTYASPGFRRVALTVTNDSGSRRTTKTLTVMPETSAATFVFSPSTPGPGQSIQFADTTTGEPISWQWNFGDNTNSSIKNPSHAFARAGSYVVTLIARTSSGSKQGSQTITVASMSVLSSSFTFSPSAPTPGQAVQFTDTSTGGPTAWTWDFGDGITSAAQNPSHIYSTAGTRTVTLTVSNGSSSTSSVRTITVATPLAASFTYSPASPATGQAVQFTDTSTGSPTSWQWNFGDGATSTAQNPSHTYATAGTRTVTLTVTNSTNSHTATRTLTLVAALTAAFNFSPSSPTAGQAVQFTDSSTGTPTLWQWDFGDGATSVTQNPSHTFTASGSYTVTLTVMNGSAQDSTSRTVAVATPSSVTASFTFSPTAPTAGQSVLFTDTSTGNPTTWSWDFADGTTSASRNPSHTFAAAGSYLVTLLASNGSVSSTAARTVTVAPATLPVASFTFSPGAPSAGQSVAFRDTSTGNPTTWQWNFGDGSAATVQNPSHTYATPGSYNVLLTITNASGSRPGNIPTATGPCLASR